MADQHTSKLPPVETNYNPEKNGSLEYLYGKDALDKFKVAPGYKIELFASEQEFADVANPVQLSFDNKGRLWVATMPSYPHYKPGDSKPNDKLIILEDTDGDGKADWMEIVTIFKRYGFEWGGDWKFNDAPHFQKTFGKTINELAELHKNDKVDKNGFVLI